MLKGMRRSRWIGGAALGAALTLSGCIGNLLSVFSDDFLSATGLSGSTAANIPGDAPALLVGVENRTDRVVVAVVSYRLQSNAVETYTALVNPGEKTAQALVCPITEITLGNVSDLDAIGAVVRLGLGGENDPFVEVEPFGVLLKESVNYDCGDALTFVVSLSGQTPSGYQTFVFRRPSQTPR